MQRPSFRRLLARATAGSLALAALLAPASAQYSLVWQDEFNGTSLDLSKWEPMIGTGCPNLCGWGNNELQYYRSQNATVSGGTLKITAKQENFGGRQYTSARLRTLNKADFTYGRFEMRAKLPTGQGMWPAFWMLPSDWVYGTWAASGEIDVMELVGHEPNRVVGSIHYGGTSPNNTYSNDSYTLPSGSFNDAFHVFALEWDETEMRWYMDGQLYAVKTSWWSSGGAYPAPFNERFHLLLNLAVGGNWPGPPDASTPFPNTFEVDWVRVYEGSSCDLTDCACLFDGMEHGDPNAAGYFTFDGAGAGGGIGGNTSDLPPSQGGSASLEAGWGNGGAGGFLGGFGFTNPLNLGQATHFEFWINPDGGQDYWLEVNLQDDDNGDNSVPSNPDGADDEFQVSLRVSATGGDLVAGGGWQKVVLPLSDFTDDNSFHFGGNGVLDLVSTGSGGNGQLINVVFALVSNSGQDVTFRTDHWNFTRRTSSLTGRVWKDLNGDGFAFGEPGHEGIVVELWDPALNSLLASTTTSVGGNYSFGSQVGGDLEVRINTASLPFGASPTADPDGLSTPHVAALNLDCDQSLPGYDFGYTPGQLGEVLCSPGNANSTGGSASIEGTGSANLALNDLTLSGTGLPTNQFGYFLNSQTPGFVIGPGGSQGNLCLAGGLGRYNGPGQVLNSASTGEVSLALDLSQTPTPSGPVAIQPGESWVFQLWYRDANPGPTSNFTDALRIAFY